MLGLGKPMVITLPQGDTSKYVIDRSELDLLVARRLIKRGDKLYTFFALMLDYPAGAEGMNIPNFCERWGIDESDAMIAIASLQKKAVLKQKAYEQLTFEFIYPPEE